MSAVLYGLPNCDSTRAAMKALEQAEINYSFHDIRKDGLDDERVERWMKKLGVDKLLNKKSTTWRELPDLLKNAVTDENSAVRLISQNVTLMKRPVLEIGGKLLAGRGAIDMIHSVTKK
jgi:Spx/MgsR family transcriptional regulator